MTRYRRRQNGATSVLRRPRRGEFEGVGVGYDLPSKYCGPSVFFSLKNY